jgi:hypothetical protein
MINDMKIHTIKEDIRVLCKLVPEFPKGIKEGFDSLIAKFGQAGRGYYGISYMENNKIIYKVAVSVSAKDDVAKSDLEPFTITKGDYLAETVTDWMPKTDQIKGIFEGLMKDQRFDDNFPCVEWYKDDKEMMCMVRIKK